MNCEKCGEVCGCPMEPPPTELSSSCVNEVPIGIGVPPVDGEPDAWRHELAARLNRYRARRKAPPPRYPSLRLPFGPAESAARANLAEETAFPHFETSSNHALALNEMQAPPADPPVIPEAHLPLPSAKIIEFPRFAWGPPSPPPDQLAEPVMDRPRILEVPEVAPPPPALGGITIEPATVQEAQKRPGIDIPLQSAPFGLRIIASIIDSLIIAIASALFGFIFWKVALIRPPQIQLFSLSIGIPCAFWAAYQYLLIVYAGSTPGLRIAHLQLTRFDGTPTTRSLRRWRILASYLSAASLGMGYAWVFLDEDELCWHDRITHTYFAPVLHTADQKHP